MFVTSALVGRRFPVSEGGQEVPRKKTGFDFLERQGSGPHIDFPQSTLKLV